MRKSARQRFMEKVSPEPNSGCWLWCGAATKEGYGFIGVGSRNMRAHRLSFELHKGSVDGMMVMHDCDNPSCVNPSHLRLGTAADNVRDMIRKGRNFVLKPEWRF